MKTLIIDKDRTCINQLKTIINSSFPQLHIIPEKGIPFIENFGIIQEQKPDLIVFELNQPKINPACLLEKLSSFNSELIVVTENKKHLLDAIKFSITAYLLKPINNAELIAAVLKAINNQKVRCDNERNKILVNRLLQQKHQTKHIGIPTIKGYDFIQVDKIIRCEGLQKYTLVVIKDKANIVSSKNLGEFRKQLEPHGFFSPHKSYMVNLNYIQHYYKEGIIVMTDNSNIPIARRRKQSFLDLISHL